VHELIEDLSANTGSQRSYHEQIQADKRNGQISRAPVQGYGGSRRAKIDETQFRQNFGITEDGRTSDKT
jgi:hypothetical protein